MSPFIKITSKYCPNCNQDTLFFYTNFLVFTLVLSIMILFSGTNSLKL